MKKIMKFIIIDDSASQIKIIRDCIKSFFNIPDENSGSEEYLDDNNIVKIYKNDDVRIEIFQIEYPTLDLIDQVITSNNKNVVAIIFDMIWSIKEREEFYDDNTSLFQLPFREMYLQIQNKYRISAKNLPGGLKFIYNWFRRWRMEFDIDPILIAKSVYSNENLEKSLMKIGIDQVINKRDAQVKDIVIRTIEKIILKYDYSIESRTIEIENNSAQGYHFIPIKVREDLTKYARTEKNILLLGEPGTGKSHVPQLIYENSARRNSPLIIVDCGSITNDSMDRILFGDNNSIGKFEMADTGTIVLDEICALPIELQSKLLYVLGKSAFTKVGDNNSKKVDVRVIATTNENIENAINLGKLRRDLYWRLQDAFTITLPALRHHKEDIPELINILLTQYGLQYRHSTVEIDDDAMNALSNYDWPGNLRQLHGIIENLCLLLDNSNIITVKELEIVFPDLFYTSFQDNELNLKDAKMKEAVIEALVKSGWVIRHAADILNMSRPTLYRLINRFELDKLIKQNKTQKKI